MAIARIWERHHSFQSGEELVGLDELPDSIEAFTVMLSIKTMNSREPEEYVLIS